MERARRERRREERDLPADARASTRSWSPAHASSPAVRSRTRTAIRSRTTSSSSTARAGSRSARTEPGTERSTPTCTPWPSSAGSSMPAATSRASAGTGAASFLVSYARVRTGWTTVSSGGAAPPPTGTPTGTVLVNGKPFTGGRIAYNSTVDVTGGTLVLRADTGTLTVRGAARLPAVFKLLRGTDKNKPIVELRLVAGDFSACPKKRKPSSVGCEPGGHDDGEAALGQRQGEIPHARPLRSRDRPRHELAHRRPLRRHPRASGPGCDPGRRLSEQKAGHGSRGSQLPGETLMPTKRPLGSG